MCREKRRELVRPHQFLVGGGGYADGEPHRGMFPDTGVRRNPLPLKTGKPTQLKEGWQKDGGESDPLIVLGDGKADHMGKGWTMLRSPQRKHVPDM